MNYHKIFVVTTFILSVPLCLRIVHVALREMRLFRTVFAASHALVTVFMGVAAYQVHTTGQMNVHPLIIGFSFVAVLMYAATRYDEKEAKELDDFWP
jgi:integral membrane sensor domain MASE1